VARPNAGPDLDDLFGNDDGTEGDDQSVFGEEAMDMEDLFSDVGQDDELPDNFEDLEDEISSGARSREGANGFGGFDEDMDSLVDDGTGQVRPPDRGNRSRPRPKVEVSRGHRIRTDLASVVPTLRRGLAVGTLLLSVVLFILIDTERRPEVTDGSILIIRMLGVAASSFLILTIWTLPRNVIRERLNLAIYLAGLGLVAISLFQQVSGLTVPTIISPAVLFGSIWTVSTTMVFSVGVVVMAVGVGRMNIPDKPLLWVLPAGGIISFLMVKEMVGFANGSPPGLGKFTIDILTATIIFTSIASIHYTLGDLMARSRSGVAMRRDVVRNINEVRSLQRSGRLDDALREVHLLVQSNPNSPQLVFLKGNILFRQGRLGEAKEEYRNTLELNRSMAPAWSNLGQVHRLLGEYDRSIAAFEEAVTIDPTFLTAQMGKARAYRDMKRPQEALAIYDRLLKRMPDHPVLWNVRGSVYLQLGDRKMTRTCYRKAITLDPEFSAAWNNLGRLYRMEGDHGQAVEAFKKALRFGGENPVVMGNLVESMIAQGKGGEANEILVRAQELAPTSEYIHSIQAQLQFRQGDFQDAYDSFLKVIHREVRMRKRKYIEGLVRYALMDDTLAVESFRLAFASEKERPQTLLKLAEELMSDREYHRARLYLDLACDIMPRNQAAWSMREVAQREVTMADRAGMKRPPVLENMRWRAMGDAFVALGKHERALGCYKNALMLDGNDVASLNKLLLALTYLGRAKEARDIQDRAVAIKLDLESSSEKVRSFMEVAQQANR